MKASLHLRAMFHPGHWHVDVFAGPDADHRAHCGQLTMRPEEAQELLSVAARAGHDCSVLLESRWEPGKTAPLEAAFPVGS